MDRPARTVLLVDKSATLRYFHGQLLTRLDYAVLTAASPEEALLIMERTGTVLRPERIPVPHDERERPHQEA